MGKRGRVLVVGAVVAACGARTGLDVRRQPDATTLVDAAVDAPTDYFITFAGEAGAFALRGGCEGLVAMPSKTCTSIQPTCLDTAMLACDDAGNSASLVLDDCDGELDACPPLTTGDQPAHVSFTLGGAAYRGPASVVVSGVAATPATGTYSATTQLWTDAGPSATFFHVSGAFSVRP